MTMKCTKIQIEVRRRDENYPNYDDDNFDYHTDLAKAF